MSNLNLFVVLVCITSAFLSCGSKVCNTENYDKVFLEYEQLYHSKSKDIYKLFEKKFKENPARAKHFHIKSLLLKEFTDQTIALIKETENRQDFVELKLVISIYEKYCLKHAKSRRYPEFITNNINSLSLNEFFVNNYTSTQISENYSLILNSLICSIRKVESDIVAYHLNQIRGHTDHWGLRNKVHIIKNKQKLKTGETFDAEFYLIAEDTTLIPKYFVDDKRLQIKNGRAVFETIAQGNKGDTIKHEGFALYPNPSGAIMQFPFEVEYVIE